MRRQQSFLGVKAVDVKYLFCSCMPFGGNPIGSQNPCPWPQANEEARECPPSVNMDDPDRRCTIFRKYLETEIVEQPFGVERKLELDFGDPSGV